MRTRTYTKILSLLGGGLLATTAASGLTPTVAEAQTIAPTEPELAAFLGLNTGSVFHLTPTNPDKRMTFDDPRAVEFCVVSGTTPAFKSLAAKVTSGDEEMVLDIGDCGVVSGTQIDITPASAIGGSQRVKGYYRVVG